MPFIYVYSPDDFVGGLPDESGAAAAGSGPFTLTLADDAQPTLIEISDDDAVFDEVDRNQTLASNVDIDGDAYSAGTSINTAYDLWNSDTGHKVTTFHFNGNGYQQGAVDGLVSTVELQPGESYTFDRERTSHRQNNEYDDYVACFADGTRILTRRGEVLVQDLQVGDDIAVKDGDFAPLRVKYSRKLCAEDLEKSANLRPVRVVAGALGAGLPVRDLLVSQQHRMTVESSICRRMFGESAAFISAKALTQLPGIFVDDQVSEVTYFHLVLDEHQVIYADGAPSESFYCGDQAFLALSEDEQKELYALFPALKDSAPDLALAVPHPRRQKRALKRMARREKTVLA